MAEVILRAAKRLSESNTRPLKAAEREGDPARGRPFFVDNRGVVDYW